MMYVTLSMKTKHVQSKHLYKNKHLFYIYIYTYMYIMKNVFMHRGKYIFEVCKKIYKNY